MHVLPWRPCVEQGEKEEDCEDLDRLVLADDVAPVLFRVRQSSACVKLVQQLVSLLCCERQESSQPELQQLDLHSLTQVCASSWPWNCGCAYSGLGRRYGSIMNEIRIKKCI
jgi:hypothetical protein